MEYGEMIPSPPLDDVVRVVLARLVFLNYMITLDMVPLHGYLYLISST